MVVCSCNLCGPYTNSCTVNSYCVIYYNSNNQFYGYECLPPLSKNITCRNDELNHFESIYYRCCQSDYCNTLDLLNEKSNINEKYYKKILYIGIPLIFCLFLTLIFVFLVFYFKKKTKIFYKSLPKTNNHTSNTQTDHPSDSHVEFTFKPVDSYEPTLSFSHESYSFDYRRILNPHNLMSLVELKELIGSGTYGNVYKGIFQNEVVAVKIQECKVNNLYEKTMFDYSWLRHPYVLLYRLCDIIPNDDRNYSWFITDYHKNGSLYNFLIHNIVSKQLFFRLVLSFLEGLSFLHCSITTKCMYKPSMAHRDIKSKNILIRDDWTCCIGDMGFVVTQDFLEAYKNANQIPHRLPNEFIVGTRRYMAPEILDESLKYQNIDSLLKTDIYSSSLVVWEIFNRIFYGLPANNMQNLQNTDGLDCINPDSSGDIQFNIEEHRLKEPESTYHLPFDHAIGREPSLSEMRKIVCQKNIRPNFCNLESIETLNLNDIKEYLEECWKSNPKGRPTSMEMHKKFTSFYDQFKEQKQ